VTAPEHMNWEDAVDELMAGYVIGREAWPENDIVVWINGSGRCTRGQLDMDDLRAADWFIRGAVQ
jgi:hypothetical protein